MSQASQHTDEFQYAEQKMAPIATGFMSAAPPASFAVPHAAAAAAVLPAALRRIAPLASVASAPAARVWRKAGVELGCRGAAAPAAPLTTASSPSSSWVVPAQRVKPSSTALLSSMQQCITVIQTDGYSCVNASKSIMRGQASQNSCGQTGRHGVHCWNACDCYCPPSRTIP